MKPKASVPGKNVLEISFAAPIRQWEETLRRLPDVKTVTSHDHVTPRQREWSEHDDGGVAGWLPLTTCHRQSPCKSTSLGRVARRTVRALQDVPCGFLCVEPAAVDLIRTGGKQCHHLAYPRETGQRGNIASGR